MKSKNEIDKGLTEKEKSEALAWIWSHVHQGKVLSEEGVIILGELDPDEDAYTKMFIWLVRHRKMLIELEKIANKWKTRRPEEFRMKDADDARNCMIKDEIWH